MRARAQARQSSSMAYRCAVRIGFQHVRCTHWFSAASFIGSLFLSFPFEILEFYEEVMQSDHRRSLTESDAKVCYMRASNETLSDALVTLSGGCLASLKLLSHKSYMEVQSFSFLWNFMYRSKDKFRHFLRAHRFRLHP